MMKFVFVFLVAAVLGFSVSLATTPNSEEALTFEPMSATSSEAKETSPVARKAKIKHLDLNSKNLVYLTSEVESFSVDKAINLIQEYNKKNKESIYLIIDSPGGSVMDGGRLMTAIEASKNKVVCINNGTAASMAFIILEHCHLRLATPRTTLMGHPASLRFMYQGELDKVVSRLTYMKGFVDTMDKAIAQRAGLKYESFKLLTQQELWIDENVAMAMNLLDGVVYINLPATSELFPASGTQRIMKDFKLE